MEFIKSVLKRVLASLITLFILSLVAIAIYVGLIFMALQTAPIDVEEESFLVISLDRNIPDAPQQLTPGEAFFQALDGTEPPMHLLHMLDVIAAAQDDDRIAGIFLAGNVFGINYGSGFPALSELRDALTEFSDSGKPVVGYLEYGVLKDLYLYSAVDTLYMNPMGGFALPGLATQSPYFAEALGKLGVGAQVVRVGDYKSAVEPFIANEMSNESREQTTAMLEDVWSRLSVEIAESRELEVTDLNQLITEDPLVSGEEAIEAGLADELVYYDTVLQKVAELGASDMDGRTFKQIPLETYANSLSMNQTLSFETVDETDLPPTVAVVYAEGDIVDGDEPSQNVAGDWLARELRTLRFDESIKAIVLRVNSPGGSAYASEVVLRELKLLNEKMPVVISMGSLAASGGYWIATENDLIMADPNTLTGSIGVFGLLFNFEELTKKWGVHFDGVQTHPYGTLYSLFEEKSPETLALIQEEVDEIYEDFLERVTMSTGIEDRDALDALAGGRVWTGSQALELGLIDKLGGLKDAIDEAVALAGLENIDYGFMEIPSVMTAEDIFAEIFNGGYSAKDLGIRDIVKPKNAALQEVVENMDRLLNTQGIQARASITGIK